MLRRDSDGLAVTRRAWPLLWTLALVSGCGTVLRTVEYLDVSHRLARAESVAQQRRRGLTEGWHAAVYNLAYRCERERRGVQR